MTLAAGARLGPYEIHSALGAGGMGEVYRARDIQLKREVAIKVLPEPFAQDPERLARFQREAEVLASLNHPNIAAVYGLERVPGITGIVLELVEGDTLDVFLKTRAAEPAGLPMTEGLSIAAQIAEALEAAHEKGIIHRDLKPANIKVTPDGKVKVLDFGLAAVAQDSSGRDVNATHSPTLTLAATLGGVIIGTAAYMSPEQASGRPVDKRADIWAFGVVLWEMVAGRRLFDGETISHTLAFVLTKEPDWNALPTDTPAPIRKLLQRCLEKDRKRRLPDIAVARLEIEDAIAELESPRRSDRDSAAPAHVSEAGARAPVAAPAARVPRWRRVLPWALAAASITALAAVVALWAPWRKGSAPSPVRVTADIGADVTLGISGAPGGNLALSPNGELFVFAGQKGSGSQLYLRRLDQLQATPLAGTEGGRYPFFKPDGQWIGFFADGKLKKVSVTGGAAVALCDATNGRGGSWGDDGTIVFTPSGSPSTTLMRVSEAGGQSEPLIKLGDGESSQRWSQLLPGSKAVLFTTSASPGDWDNGSIVVQPLPDGPRKVVQRGGFHGRYVSSGHLVYVHGGTLFAVPFDLGRLETAGQAVPVVEGVNASVGTAGAQFAVSDSGTLVYLAGQSTGNAAPIVWMDRDGKTSPLRATPTNWSNPRFSPDGTRLAIDIAGGGLPAIWVDDWARDTPTRLTFGGLQVKPVWTPDGRRIVFSSGARGEANMNLYWQRADGTGDVQRLTQSKNDQLGGSWHPSGKFLAFTEMNARTNSDILILPMDGDETSGWKPGKPTPFLNTPFNEQEPRFSPDGRWLAYFSNESGGLEVYVRPFPTSVGKWQISTGGGAYPVWSPTRRELFYATVDQQIMVVPYTVDGESFRAEKPQLWSSGRFAGRQRLSSYDLHPDGARFAVAPAPDAQSTPDEDKVVFVFNFFDELRRVAPKTRG